MGVYIPYTRLPSTYQEVEYIQSSGTQYISTGYNPKQNTEFEIEYEIVSYNQRYSVPMGTRKDHNIQAYYFGYENNNNSYYGFGNNKADPSSVAFHGIGIKRKITYHNNILSNGTQSVTVATNQQPYGTIRIFGEEQNGSVQELGAMKLYMFKLREGETLVRDFVPCYRKADTTIGMYDLVNDVFYTNAGTGTFTKGDDVMGELKNAYIGEKTPFMDYQEVEWIGTSGIHNSNGQRINTGVSLTNNIQVETFIEVNTTEMDNVLFGSVYSGSASAGNIAAYYHLTPYANAWYFGINGSEGHGGTYSNVVGTKYKIVFNNADGYLNIDDNNIVSCSGATGYLGSTLGISTRRSSSSTIYNGSANYYYFNVYDKSSGEYLRKFVPCYRKSDSVIGMYDLVNDQFYTNSGRGTFTKGPDVS